MSTARDWFAKRTYHHHRFPLEELLRAKGRQQSSITVCLPTREVADTIGATLEEIQPLKDAGLVDQVVVVDADSKDGTSKLAVEYGAEVFQEQDLCSDFGRCMGKGDAMWRALSVVEGDIAVFVDSDSRNFAGHYVTGLVGPLLSDDGVQYVKASYRRPFTVGGLQHPEGGGRVNELCARPLLNLFYPELAGFHQPLAGEMAARYELLARLPFYTSYAVEISLLIDAYRAAGLDALAQVYLGSRQNAHQPLRDLGPMAYTVLRAVTSHLADEGRLPALDAAEFLTPIMDATPELIEWRSEIAVRPPHDSGRPAACTPAGER